MTKKRKRWTASEKLEIIQLSDHLGVAEASRKYGISSTMIYRWRTKYEQEGVDGLTRSQAPIDQEKKDLEREIERLRQVVADQALTIRIKDEMLKKNRYR